MFNQLQEFIQTHGRLPKRREEDCSEALFLWMCRARDKYEAGKLTDDLEQQLNQLTPNPLASGLRAQRLTTMSKIRSFREEHGRWPGHSSCPAELALYRTLKSWKARLRFSENRALADDLQTHLPELVEHFDAGANFHTANDSAFIVRLANIQKFHQQHGRMPKTTVKDKDEYRLARWYSTVTRKHENGGLSPFKAEAFEALQESLEATTDSLRSAELS